MRPSSQPVPTAEWADSFPLEGMFRPFFVIRPRTPRRPAPEAEPRPADAADGTPARKVPARQGNEPPVLCAHGTPHPRHQRPVPPPLTPGVGSWNHALYPWRGLAWQGWARRAKVGQGTPGWYYANRVLLFAVLAVSWPDWLNVYPTHAMLESQPASRISAFS